MQHQRPDDDEPRRRSWSGSRPTAARGCRRCSPPATRCSRSTRCRWPATGNGTPPRGPRATRATRRCWPTWSAPTGTTTGRSPVTASWPRRSRCWPGRTSRWCWMRGRQANLLRSTLREFYPAALDAFDELTSRDALAVLAIAPTPAAGRGAVPVEDRRRAAPRRVGNATSTTRAEQIQAALRAPQLEQPPLVADAFGATVTAWSRCSPPAVTQIAASKRQLEAPFGQHPDAEIVLSPARARHRPRRPGARRVRRRPRTATPTPRPARTTPGPARSPTPPAPDASCSPATRPTSGCATRSTCKPSPP